MDSLRMECCRFPSFCRASSSFKCPQNISPFKFLHQKISIPFHGGNNAALFISTPVVKKGLLKMTVSASSSAANKGGGMDKEKKPKETDDDKVEGICSKLVKRNRYARNLGQKLEIIRDIVAENINSDKRLEALTYSAIYLKWINTGQIPWSEDGGPHKGAEISRHIFCHLEQIYSRNDASIEDILVIRKIHHSLASLKAKFTNFVPVTRTEDGVHQELTELFISGSLEGQLESVRDSLDHNSSALPRFLESKQILVDIKEIPDIPNDQWMTMLMNVLEALDNLREEIVEALKSELQNHATDAAILMRQKLRLCEIGLEDYSYILLSSFLKSLEAADGAHWLANNVKQKNLDPWNDPLRALIISIHQLGLSGWKSEECRAITNELKAWQKKPLLETEGGECGMRIWGLRLKATLDRADRLTEEYPDTLLNMFPQKVEMLGEAFGVLDSRMKTYTEAEICAGVVFQVSNLCSLLSKAVRNVVEDRIWDVLVPGVAFGKLIKVENIRSIPSFETEPVIVVVDKVEADEEVSTEAEINGVILLQGIPRLSHLVFKARKENIVVVTCEDKEEMFRIQHMRGEEVNLVASFSDGVRLKTPDSLSSTPSFSSLPRNMSNADSTESEPDVMALEVYTGVSCSVGAVRVEEAENLARKAGVKTENICGAKAASCCRLASLAAESSLVKDEVGVPALFKVPKGAVIPFGSIRGALDRDGTKSGDFWSLVESIDRSTLLNEISSLRERLHHIVSWLSPLEKVLEVLSKIFPDEGVQLILRPSASVEDLREMEVVERDDPIIAASLSNPSLLRYAISRVWASLYTPEAFRSRRAARVDERVADMAVLVQEMLSPEHSFVIRIVGPTSRSKMTIGDGEVLDDVEIDENKDLVGINIESEDRKGTIEVDIAPGLKKALTLDTRASPWRLSYDKRNGVVETLAFSNFSEELVVPSGGTHDERLIKFVVDYSKKPLTIDSHFRQQLGRRLGAIGLFLAKKFQGRWDVEGCVVGDDIYIVRMRPQPQQR